LHDQPTVHLEGSAHGVRVVLADEGGISGRVLLDGRPMTNYVLIPAPASNDRSDDDATLIRAVDGRFAKRELPTGTWIIKIAAQGCELAKVDGVVTEAGKVHDIGDVTLQRGPRVSGHVYESSGVGVSGARVSVGWPGETGPMHALLEGRAEATTDASGAYVLDAVPRASFFPRRPIRASHPTLGISEEHDLGDTETTVDFTLNPVGGIDGVVDGFLGDQTFLMAHRRGGPGAGQAEVDRAGEFHFDGLPVGTYSISDDGASGNPRVKPFAVTVEPSRRVRVHAVIETNTVTVLARVVSSCTENVFIRPSDDSGGEVANFPCTKDITTLRYIAPGSYRACDWSKRCTTVTVAATPPTQSIDINLESAR
jgi:protocatechuate 3,4-dioxygenase beta subunit